MDKYFHLFSPLLHIIFTYFLSSHEVSDTSSFLQQRFQLLPRASHITLCYFLCRCISFQLHPQLLGMSLLISSFPAYYFQIFPQLLHIIFSHFLSSYTQNFTNLKMLRGQEKNASADNESVTSRWTQHEMLYLQITQDQ